MTSLTQDIQDKLKRLNAFEKIIGINVAIYLFGWLLWRIQRMPRTSSLDWLELPVSLTDVLLKPWAVLTYGFAHYGFWHLLFNMLVLYFLSRSFSNLFRPKMSLSVYLLGILSGAAAFVLVLNVLPNSMVQDIGPLIGASAGVHALLLFLSTYMPDYEIRIITFNVKLKYITIALVLFDLLGLFSMNSGGNIAHIGGDILGFMYAYQLKKGHDIGQGFSKLTDRIANWFQFKKTSNLKTVHKRKGQSYAGHTKKEFNEFNNQKQIDLILDKISKSGYDSLSKSEKEFLFKSGKK